MRLDLDLSGILKVTATERATGLARQVTIDNAMERFRKRQRTDAVDRLEEVFATVEGYDEDEVPALEGPEEEEQEVTAPSLRDAINNARDLIGKAEKVRQSATPEDASELDAMLADLNAALERRSEEDILRASAELGDLVFYLEDR